MQGIQIIFIVFMAIASVLEFQAIEWLKWCRIVALKEGSPQEVNQALGIINERGGFDQVRSKAELQLMVCRGSAIVLLVVISTPPIIKALEDFL